MPKLFMKKGEKWGDQILTYSIYNSNFYDKQFCFPNTIFVTLTKNKITYTQWNACMKLQHLNSAYDERCDSFKTGP